MKGKKISVIIPAYNVEKYIRRCLDSLVSQTYENLEIIVVNDGSTDATGDILQEYAARFPGKVIPFHRENSGQAEARNFGMTKATGEYIGFVDSDDFVSAVMYEKMYREAEENGCDLVTCGYYGCDDVTGEITVYQTGYKGEFNQSIYENPHILRVNSPYPWNKLYTKELLERAEFQFKKGIIFEDLCAVFPLFMDAKKVGRVHEKLYYYIKGRKGGTISTFDERHGQIIDSLRIMNEAYTKRGMFETFYDTLLFFNIRHIYARFDEMERYENESFKKEFTERAYALLDEYFPGWQQSGEFQAFRSGGAGEEEEENENGQEHVNVMEEKAESSVPGNSSTVEKKEKKRRRSEIFETLVSERKIQKNVVLIECYHGNDIQGAGYFIGKMLAGAGGYTIYMAAADEKKRERFRELYGETWQYVDLNSEQYLEILATAEYVVNNRAFPGFYRKRKGQRFIFTDFMPSLRTQGKDVVYGAKNMQGIQFSLAQADVIPFPEELKEMFVPLLASYHMGEICRDKGYYVPLSSYFSSSSHEWRKPGETAVAYLPSIKAFPGLKDAKSYLFLSDLKRKLTELDEKIEDGHRVYVRFPRIIRRRFKENIWKHISFFPEEAEPVEVIAGCDGLIGEYGEELYMMKALGRPVCRFVTDEPDVRWSDGLTDGECREEFQSYSVTDDVAQWINALVCGTDKAVREQAYGTKPAMSDWMGSLKTGKNHKVGRKTVYVPKIEKREELIDWLKHYPVQEYFFFIEKENMAEGMACWLKSYDPEIRYSVIIRSIVLSDWEKRLIKYRLTTKEKLREKRDRERYLGV